MLVDDGDADRGADRDVLAGDIIGRADGGDDALRQRHHLRRVIADAGRDHREFVAAEPRHQIAAAQRMRQPQRDVADQFVAGRMAERVIDVLEMVEIDIKHGGRFVADGDFVDHRFEAFAEENAVGQAAERVMHRKVAQPAFAGGDRFRGAAHVTQHEGGQQRETGERHRDERHHALDDFGARLFRRPGKACDRLAVRRVS